MQMDAFLAEIDDKSPPAPESEILRLQDRVGAELPRDYRDFLIACNGGYVGGALWFTGTTPTGETADAGVHHIGGFRREDYLSLHSALDTYHGRIPADLLWIMDDPFGNAICIGLNGGHAGRVFFWDHENEPYDRGWDGRVETAGNLTLLTNSFSEFVEGLHPTDDFEEQDQE